MKTKTTYKIVYSYNAGLLGTDIYFKTDDEARQFEEYYKTEFKDCNKGFITYRITENKFLGISVGRGVEEVRSWWEE